MNNNITLDMNIYSYDLNHLSYPDISTYHIAGGPITQTTKHIGLNKYHRGTVERTSKMVNECIEKGVQYT